MITPKSGNPAPIARYIGVDLFGRMLTYGAVVAGGWGLWIYEMIRRERAARIAAENKLAELQNEREAERRQTTEELLRIAEERRQIAEERRLAAEVRLRLVDIISALATQQCRR